MAAVHLHFEGNRRVYWWLTAGQRMIAISSAILYSAGSVYRCCDYKFVFQSFCIKVSVSKFQVIVQPIWVLLNSVFRTEKVEPVGGWLF